MDAGGPSAASVDGLREAPDGGPGGGMWETARLSLCCLRLDSIEGPLLRGVACGTDDGDRPFEVDLRDGSHRGGW